MVIPDEGPGSARDAFARFIGIETVAYADGEATCAVVVRPELTNAIGRSHGGLVFALADAAIARASNRPGEPAVVTASSIQILRATAPGDRLVAHAVEEHRGQRIGAYRATVRSDDRIVAVVTAQSFRIEPQVAEADAASRGRSPTEETE